jgi:transcriptional regulator with XRE-family HTH domain
MQNSVDSPFYNLLMPEKSKQPTDYQRRLQQARKAAGMTCQQLGEELGMSRQSISQFELGKQSMDIATFLKACHTVGVHSTWVLEGTGPMLMSSVTPRQTPRPARRTQKPSPETTNG